MEMGVYVFVCANLFLILITSAPDQFDNLLPSFSSMVGLRSELTRAVVDVVSATY
jgi:hypothetical protein